MASRAVDPRLLLRPVGLLALVLGAGCGAVDVIGDVTSPTQPPPVDDAGGPAAPGGPPPPGRGAGPAGELACEAAPTLFGSALCACGPVAVLGNLATSYAPEAPATEAARADVGVLGTLQAAAFVGPIAGDLTVSGPELSVLVGVAGSIAGTLRVEGPLGVQGLTAIAGDAWLGGQALGEGTLIVQGDLHRRVAAPLPPPLSMRPDAIVAVTGQTLIEAFTVPTRCPCDAARALDVAAVVERVAASTPSSATTDAVARALTQASSGASVELPQGAVVVPEIAVEGDLVLRVSGTTALYVDGPLRVAGALRAELADTAELELWVGGGIAFGGPIMLGTPEQAAAVRMYVAGGWIGEPDLPTPGPEIVEGLDLPPQAMNDSPDERWNVNLYAPALDLGVARDTELFGSLVVRSLLGVGNLHVHYDPAVVAAGASCDAP